MWGRIYKRNIINNIRFDESLKIGEDYKFNQQIKYETKISCDWITEVETRALAKESLKFSVSENMTPYEREGEIIFSSGEIVQKLRVLQSPSLCKGNQLKYISSDGKIVQPRVDAYFGGATVVSNEYKNGEGIITFDKDVTLIGEMAFAECANITHLGLPSNLTSIGNYAFYGCLLNSVTIPESVASIGYDAFVNGVKEVKLESTTPPTLKSSSLISDYGVLIVPNNALLTYQTAKYWSDLISKMSSTDMYKREVTLEAMSKQSALHQALGESALPYIVDLTINGTINSYDFMFIYSYVWNNIKKTAFRRPSFLYFLCILERMWYDSIRNDTTEGFYA